MEMIVVVNFCFVFRSNVKDTWYHSNCKAVLKYDTLITKAIANNDKHPKQKKIYEVHEKYFRNVKVLIENCDGRRSNVWKYHISRRFHGYFLFFSELYVELSGWLTNEATPVAVRWRACDLLISKWKLWQHCAIIKCSSTRNSSSTLCEFCIETTIKTMTSLQEGWY